MDKYLTKISKENVTPDPRVMLKISLECVGIVMIDAGEPMLLI